MIYRLLRVNITAELIKKIVDEEIESSTDMRFDNTFKADTVELEEDWSQKWILIENSM